MTNFLSHDLTELPYELPGKIYRSPMPFGAYDPQQWVLEHALQAGVEVVVDMVPDHEALYKTGKHLRNLYNEKGLEVIHLPVADFEAPEDGALDEALHTVLQYASQGRNIMVHCNAGYGRTGTFLACLRRLQTGIGSLEAVQWVRKFIPPALENEQQLDFISRYNTGNR